MDHLSGGPEFLEASGIGDCLKIKLSFFLFVD